MTRAVKRYYILLAILVGLVACGPEAPSAPAPAAVPTFGPTPTEVSGNVGQRVAAAGVALTVSRAEFSPGSAQERPDTGKQFLLVHIVIENTDSSRDLAISLGDFRIRDASGSAVDSEPLGFISDPLQDSVLPPKGQVSATLGFTVNANAKGLHLLYDFNEQHIDFDLGM